MTNLKYNFVKRCFLLTLLCVAAMISPVSATAYPSPDYVSTIADDSPDEIKIKIIIIIIIKKKKPKVAEVTSFLLDPSSYKAKANELRAEVEIVKNSLNIKMADPDIKGMTIVVPDGIRVPQEIAKQLGKGGSFKIAGGKIQMEGNKLGNFEIQD